MPRIALLKAPDGSLVRSLVFDDGSEVLDALDSSSLPTLPALFAGELDAKTVAELYATLHGQPTLIRPRPLFELSNGAVDAIATQYEVTAEMRHGG